MKGGGQDVYAQPVTSKLEDRAERLENASQDMHGQVHQKPLCECAHSRQNADREAKADRHTYCHGKGEAPAKTKDREVTTERRLHNASAHECERGYEHGGQRRRRQHDQPAGNANRA
jgi:hypothetical protein